MISEPDGRYGWYFILRLRSVDTSAGGGNLTLNSIASGRKLVARVCFGGSGKSVECFLVRW